MRPVSAKRPSTGVTLLIVVPVLLAVGLYVIEHILAHEWLELAVSAGLLLVSILTVAKLLTIYGIDGGAHP